MAEIYVTLEEAAGFEGIKYNTMIQRMKRNPEAFKTKLQPSENGGKDRVLVALSSLSKKARKAHKKTQHVEGSDVVVDKYAAEDIPWYIGIDLNWYIENFSKQYYKAVELAKTIQEFLDYKGADKTGFSKQFAKKHGMAQRTLYRHAENYLEGSVWALKLSKEDGKNHDFYKVLALCRKPKKRFQFPSLSDEQKAFIENLWFNKDFASNFGTVEMVYGKLVQVSEHRGWTCPHYSTLARYINFLMEVERGKNAHYLAQKGSREYRNRVMVKASRDTKSLPVMGLVQGDEHTFDCWVSYRHPNGKVSAIKPKLVAWIDMRTRVIVGDVMCLNANSQILKQSLLNVIYKYGVPQWLLIDNGKDYTAETMTGRKRNDRVSFDSETKGFYRSIGIQDDMRSIPYQPWSKAQVERFFGTVCQQFTKWMRSYTGTLTGSKTAAKVKKDINGMLERNELLTMDEFYGLWEKWRDEVYHCKEHGGLKKMKEKWTKPIELFENAENKYIKPAPPKSFATMLMMRADRVHVYNIGIKKFGYEYRADELADYIGEKVDVKWDENDVTRLYVFTRDGRKICEAVSQELLMIAPKVAQEALEKHLRAQKRQERRDKERLKEWSTPFEERVQQHNDHPGEVAGFMIGKEGSELKPKDNVVSLPNDKQFREEVKNKKDNKEKEGSEFYKKQAKQALAVLRKLG